MPYSLELKQVIEKINQSSASLILLQLPDGLKPQTESILHQINQKTKKKTKQKYSNKQILIWLGSCFGACDLPALPPTLSSKTLLIQWGHSPWLQ